MATTTVADIDGLRKQIRANAINVFPVCPPPGKNYDQSSTSDEYLSKVYEALTVYEKGKGYCAILKCWHDEEDRVAASGAWLASPQATLESLLRVLSERVLVYLTHGSDDGDMDKIDRREPGDAAWINDDLD